MYVGVASFQRAKLLHLSRREISEEFGVLCRALSGYVPYAAADIACKGRWNSPVRRSNEMQLTDADSETADTVRRRPLSELPRESFKASWRRVSGQK